jgi:uncharacterized surface protein with fasciclin (FAS1) repeats
MPENKATLTKVLTYHVVPGRLTARDIAAKAKMHGSKAMLTTVEGKNLTAWEKVGAWYLTDAKGSTSKITVPNVVQSKGVNHVVDMVLMP